MSRRPYLEHVALSMHVPRGFEGLWKIILDLDLAGPWAAADVVARTDVDTGTVRDFIRRLIAGGYAQVADRRYRKPQAPHVAVYRLIQRPTDCPRIRRDGTRLRETQNETIWRTMKMAKVFTFDEIGELASSDGAAVKRESVKRYITELQSAGVVACVDAGGSGRPGRYRLVRNLGARAPKILRAHVVFDPNSNTVLGVPEAKEVA